MSRKPIRFYDPDADVRCPICRQDFSDCPHSLAQANERVDERRIRRIVREEIRRNAQHEGSSVETWGVADTVPLTGVPVFFEYWKDERASEVMTQARANKDNRKYYVFRLLNGIAKDLPIIYRPQ